MDTRQLIETYYTAWTTGDLVTARGCLADDLDSSIDMNIVICHDK